MAGLMVMTTPSPDVVDDDVGRHVGAVALAAKDKAKMDDLCWSNG